MGDRDSVAEKLKEVLGRIDLDGDGMLNFKEFRQGIRNVGIDLPEKEVLSIWQQAGAGGDTVSTSEPAGVQTFREGMRPGERSDEHVSTVRKMVPEGTARCWGDHISQTMTSKDDVEVSGIDGVHSHKKMNDNKGSDSIESGPGGLYTAANTEMRGWHRPNLEKDSQMIGGHVAVDYVPPKTPLSKEQTASHDIMMSPAYSEEYTGVRAAVMERDGRGREWGLMLEKEREAEKEAGKGEGKFVRAGIVNARILRTMQEKSERVRKAMSIIGSNSAVSFDDLRQGLGAAGLLLGEGDAKAVWAAAGGDVYADGAVGGQVNLDNFMAKMAKQAKEQDQMLHGGYAEHMRSSLNKGWEVRDDAAVLPITGMTRGKARPLDHAQIIDVAAVEQQMSPVRPANTLKKWEEQVRSEISNQAEKVKKAFGVSSPSSMPHHQLVAAAAGSGGGGAAGVPLTYTEMRDGLASAGINVSDRDYETLWRRVDRGCVGAVTFGDLTRALNVSGKAVKSGEKKSRKKFALPHMMDEEPDSPIKIQTHPRTAELDHTDHVGLDMLRGNPEFIDSLHTILSKRGSVSKGDFSRALAQAGTVISDADAADLYRKAERRSDGGKVTPGDVLSLFRPTEEIVKPQHPASLLGFGTGEYLAGQQEAYSAPSARKNGGNSSVWDPREHDEKVSKIYAKVKSSQLGNPHRLRRAFKNFDQEGKGEVTRSEFLQVLLNNNAPISRDEGNMLARIADTHCGGTVSYEEFIQTLTTAKPHLPGGGSRRRGGGLNSEASRESVGNRSMASESSFRLDRRPSTASVRSDRSNASFRSVSSQMSTSSFMGVERERSDWMTDPRVKENSRKAARPQSANNAHTPSRERSAINGGGGMILHLATPPPPGRF